MRVIHVPDPEYQPDEQVLRQAPFPGYHQGVSEHVEIDMQYRGAAQPRGRQQAQRYERGSAVSRVHRAGPVGHLIDPPDCEQELAAVPAQHPALAQLRDQPLLE